MARGDVHGPFAMRGRSLWESSRANHSCWIAELNQQLRLRPPVTASDASALLGQGREEIQRALCGGKGFRVVVAALDSRVDADAARQRDGRRLGRIAGLSQLGEELFRFVAGCFGLFIVAERARHARVLLERDGAHAGRRGTFQFLGQRAEVVDFALGEIGDHVQSPRALELAREVVGEITEQLLRLLARLLCYGFRAFRALRARSRQTLPQSPRPPPARCTRWPPGARG